VTIAALERKGNIVVRRCSLCRKTLIFETIQRVIRRSPPVMSGMKGNCLDLQNLSRRRVVTVGIGQILSTVLPSDHAVPANSKPCAWARCGRSRGRDRRPFGEASLQKTSFDKGPSTSASAARGSDFFARPIFCRDSSSAGPTRGSPTSMRHAMRRMAKPVDVLRSQRSGAQTDLLLARSRKPAKSVNVKKGQFLSAAVEWQRCRQESPAPVIRTLLVHERGASFGYNTLVSDIRARRSWRERPGSRDLRRHPHRCKHRAAKGHRRRAANASLSPTKCGGFFLCFVLLLSIVFFSWGGGCFFLVCVAFGGGVCSSRSLSLSPPDEVPLPPAAAPNGWRRRSRRAVIRAQDRRARMIRAIRIVAKRRAVAR